MSTIFFKKAGGSSKAAAKKARKLNSRSPGGSNVVVAVLSVAVLAGIKEVLKPGGAASTLSRGPVAVTTERIRCSERCS